MLVMAAELVARPVVEVASANWKSILPADVVAEERLANVANVLVAADVFTVIVVAPKEALDDAVNMPETYNDPPTVEDA